MSEHVDKLAKEASALFVEKTKAEFPKISRFYFEQGFKAAYLLRGAEIEALRTELESVKDEFNSANFNLKQKEKEIGRAEHRGNTVDYIYDKCALYGRKFDEMRAELEKARADLREADADNIEIAQGGIKLMAELAAEKARSANLAEALILSLAYTPHRKLAEEALAAHAKDEGGK